MRVILLYSLFMICMAGSVGCLSAAKESSKGVISSVIDDLDEADLSDSAVEALAVGEANGTSAFTYVGLSLFAIGAFSFAFLARDAGVKLMACGAIAGAVPYVVQSSYFAIIINSAIVLALLIGVWHLWFKIRQSENSEQSETSNNAEEKPKS